MATVNGVDQSGFTALGSALTGGGALPATIGYDQGALVGAKTQEAMLTAQAARDKAAAIQKLQDPDFQAKIGVDSVTGNRWANMVAMGLKPEDAANAVAKDRDTQARAAIAAGTGGIKGQYDNAASVDPTIVKDRYQQLGTGNFADISGATTQPGAVYTSSVGQSDIAKNNADAALKNREATNPELYHFPPIGSAAGPIDPQVAAHFGDQVHNGTMSMSNFTGRLAGYAPAVATYIAQTYPDFNVGDTQGVKTAAEKSWVGNGANAKNVTSLNMIAQHLDLAEQLSKQLDNGSFQPTNELAQKWAKLTGSPAPTNMSAVNQFLGPEVVKYLNANGGTGDERGELTNAMALNSAPAQFSGTADTIRGLLGGRVTALRQQRIGDHGSDDLDSRLVPEALKYFSKKAQAAQSAGTTPAAAPSDSDILAKWTSK